MDQEDREGLVDPVDRQEMLSYVPYHIACTSIIPSPGMWDVVKELVVF